MSLLDLDIACVGFGCCCCQIQLLVLFDLAVGLAGFNCGFLLGSDACSCWIGSLVCWTFVGLLFGWVLIKFMMVSYINYPLVLVCWILVLFGLVLLGSCLVWFCLVWFGVFCNFPLSLLCGFVFLPWNAGWPLF